jgi:RNA polymerase sigma-70 factor (ECF subfamily)
MLNYDMFTQPAIYPFLGNFFPFHLSNLLTKTGWFSHFATIRPLKGLQNREDLDLTQEALSGEGGFEKLVKNFEQMVYRVAYRYLNHEADACDVTQEVFLRVHRSLPSFRGESSLKTWIYAITANMSRNVLRSRKARAKVQVLVTEDNQDKGPNLLEKAVDMRSPGALRTAESIELRMAIEKALQFLPPEYREAVILRDLEGLEYEQIAQVLKTGEGTVKSRISRGRALLREALKDWL